MISKENRVLLLFLAALIFCIISGTDLLIALFAGMLLFGGYSISCGHSVRQTMVMLFGGMAKVRDILIIFGLIGCLTAIWRACGTIPFILYHSIGWIRPQFFVVCTFLLCCLLSFLTGTSFGTASTMGVICMMISQAIGLNPAMTGGAILSGIFFGDRCSMMSSSAQLVCSLTGTNIYQNVHRMMRTGAVPFVLTVIFYVLAASGSSVEQIDSEFLQLFESNFSLHWTVVLPAVLVVVLALCRIPVKIAMAISIFCGIVLAVVSQNVSASSIPWLLWKGYLAEPGTQLAVLMDGGGILSMVRVGLIVLISASFSGIFAETELLRDVRTGASKLAEHMNPFGTTIIASIAANAVSCNQSLGTILTCQICENLYDSKEELAIALENTVIVIAALIPWSIAGAVPLATVGAPFSSMLFAGYLYLIPLWNLLVHRRRL